jgi:hypothetical protein
MTQMHPTTGQVTEYQGSSIDAYDADRVEEQARALARAYHERPGEPIAIDFQPGNGTRYFMVFTPLDEGARQMAGNDWILSLPDYRACYTLSLPCHMVPSYVQQKFLPGISDAVPVSHLLISASKAIRLVPS